jgi:nucleotide-binding universal stress UspA family protein
VVTPDVDERSCSYGRGNSYRRSKTVFKTIALGLDGSENSRRAIPLAQELASQSGGRIVVVHVEERTAYRGGSAALHADEPDTQKQIEGEAERIRGAGLDVKVVNETAILGGPAHAIAKVADDEDADVIVVGTRGRSQVKGLLLGSVTDRLLHIAKRPVLGVPPAD